MMGWRRTSGSEGRKREGKGGAGRDAGLFVLGFGLSRGGRGRCETERPLREGVE